VVRSEAEARLGLAPGTMFPEVERAAQPPGMVEVGVERSRRRISRATSMPA
jgi:hypothetical protein